MKELSLSVLQKALRYNFNDGFVADLRDLALDVIRYPHDADKPESHVVIEVTVVVDASLNNLGDNSVSYHFWHTFPNAWWINFEGNPLSKFDAYIPRAFGKLNLKNTSFSPETISCLQHCFILRFFGFDDRPSIIRHCPDIWTINDDFIVSSERLSITNGKLSESKPDEPIYITRTMNERETILIHAAQSLPKNHLKSDYEKLEIILEDYLNEVDYFNEIGIARQKLDSKPMPTVNMTKLYTLPRIVKLDLSVILTVSMLFVIPSKIFQDAMIVLLNNFLSLNEIEDLGNLPVVIKTAVISLLRRVVKKELTELQLLNGLLPFEYSVVTTPLISAKRVENKSKSLLDTFPKDNMEMHTYRPAPTFDKFEGFHHLRYVKQYIDRPVIASEKAELLSAQKFTDLEYEIVKYLPDIVTRATFPRPGSPEFRSWVPFACRHGVLLLTKSPSCPSLTRPQTTKKDQMNYGELLPLLEAATMTYKDLNIDLTGHHRDGRMQVNVPKSSLRQEFPIEIGSRNNSLDINMGEEEHSEGLKKSTSNLELLHGNNVPRRHILVGGQVLAYGSGLPKGIPQDLSWTHPEHINRNYDMPWKGLYLDKDADVVEFNDSMSLPENVVEQTSNNEDTERKNLVVDISAMVTHSSGNILSSVILSPEGSESFSPAMRPKSQSQSRPVSSSSSLISAEKVTEGISIVNSGNPLHQQHGQKMLQNMISENEISVLSNNISELNAIKSDAIHVTVDASEHRIKPLSPPRIVLDHTQANQWMSCDIGSPERPQSPNKSHYVSNLSVFSADRSRRSEFLLTSENRISREESTEKWNTLDNPIVVTHPDAIDEIIVESTHEAVMLTKQDEMKLTKHLEEINEKKLQSNKSKIKLEKNERMRKLEHFMKINGFNDHNYYQLMLNLSKRKEKEPFYFLKPFNHKKKQQQQQQQEAQVVISSTESAQNEARPLSQHKKFSDKNRSRFEISEAKVSSDIEAADVNDDVLRDIVMGKASIHANTHYNTNNDDINDEQVMKIIFGQVDDNNHANVKGEDIQDIGDHDNTAWQDLVSKDSVEAFYDNRSEAVRNLMAEMGTIRNIRKLHGFNDEFVNKNSKKFDASIENSKIANDVENFRRTHWISVSKQLNPNQNLDYLMMEGSIGEFSDASSEPMVFLTEQNQGEMNGYYDYESLNQESLQGSEVSGQVNEDTLRTVSAVKILQSQTQYRNILKPNSTVEETAKRSISGYEIVPAWHEVPDKPVFMLAKDSFKPYSTLSYQPNTGDADESSSIDGMGSLSTPSVTPNVGTRRDKTKSFVILSSAFAVDEADSSKVQPIEPVNVNGEGNVPRADNEDLEIEAIFGNIQPPQIHFQSLNIASDMSDDVTGLISPMTIAQGEADIDNNINNSNNSNLTPYTSFTQTSPISPSELARLVQDGIIPSPMFEPEYMENYSSSSNNNAIYNNNDVNLMAKNYKAATCKLPLNPGYRVTKKKFEHGNNNASVSLPLIIASNKMNIHAKELQIPSTNTKKAENGKNKKEFIAKNKVFTKAVKSDSQGQFIKGKPHLIIWNDEGEIESVQNDCDIDFYLKNIDKSKKNAVNPKFPYISQRNIDQKLTVTKSDLLKKLESSNSYVQMSNSAVLSYSNSSGSIAMNNNNNRYKLVGASQSLGSLNDSHIFDDNI